MGLRCHVTDVTKNVRSEKSSIAQRLKAASSGPGIRRAGSPALPRLFKQFDCLEGCGLLSVIYIREFVQKICGIPERSSKLYGLTRSSEVAHGSVSTNRARLRRSIST